MESSLNGYLTRTAEFLLRLSWAWDFKMTHIHLQAVPPPSTASSSSAPASVEKADDDILGLFQVCFLIFDVTINLD